MNIVSVAFAVNESYSPHLEMALFSLLTNGKKSFYEIYVLSFDMSKSSRRKLEKICKHFDNASIRFVDLDDSNFKGFKILEHFSKDMYSRYLLADLLPDKDRILYLDADILITDDLSDLYNTGIDDYYAAGVRDYGISQDMFKDYLMSLDLHDRPYFNSGVLLFNLKKIREDNKVQSLMDETVRLFDKIKHPDQDVINIVFKEKIKPLGGIWNYQDDDRRTGRISLDDAVIIHYTSGNKPWNTPNSERGYNSLSHHLYEQYLYNYLEVFDKPDKISVIIPVYNTSREYLEECFNSVLGQTYRNIEVIAVDDGSKDSATLNYLESIEKQDRRLRVIHKSNEGTNMARRDGFRRSKGDYVVFVDSDDSIALNFIYKLYMARRNHRAEIAICESWDEVIRPMALNPHGLKTRVIRGKNKVAEFAVNGAPDLRINGGVLWGKIYKRDLLQAVDWDLSNYKLTEDEFVSVQIFNKDMRIVIFGEQLYYYRRHVSTSKEYALPAYNTFNGEKIPMLKTADNLFEVTITIFKKNNISYSQDNLLKKYAIMIDAQVRGLLSSKNLNLENRSELERQSQKYIPLIIESSAFSDEEKIRLAIVLGSPEVLAIYDNKLISIRSNIHELQGRIDSCYSENRHLRSQLDDFLKLGRSLKLVAGNVKRRAARLARKDQVGG